ncbi:MAG: pro-sigmaK processing inhibitor BofA family protein [Oscillospiraceae bacterium]|nr:pro-sigmaK processing inhibitor BofA family protein [Oscillospiraceae bacterium]
MNTSFWFAALLLCAGVILFVCYARTGKMFRCVLFTAFTGALALGVIRILCNFFPIGLAVTPYSLLTSLFLGVPGVLTMLLMLVI